MRMRFLGAWVPVELYEEIVKYQRRNYMTKSELLRAALRALLREERREKEAGKN